MEETIPVNSGIFVKKIRVINATMNAVFDYFKHIPRVTVLQCLDQI